MNFKHAPSGVIALASLGFCMTAQAGGPPPLYDIYTCAGGSWDGGYTADVTLDDPWRGYEFQLEDDVDGSCKDKKADGFACSGGGNLISSRVDDAVVLYPVDGAGATASLVANAPTGGFAVVSADIFDPGSCAVAVSCDHDGDGADETPTPEIDCYYSGFGGGPHVDGSFATSEEACTETAANNGEGMFAEGTPFSPNRPKNGSSNTHKNWAMYVELGGSCTAAVIAVPADDPAPDCGSVVTTVDAIYDGGDYDLVAPDAGDITFTPAEDCNAQLLCEDSESDVGCAP